MWNDGAIRGAGAAIGKGLNMGNQVMAQQAQPVVTTKIQREMARLNEAMSVLEEAIYDLKKRLTPVLLPESPEVAGDSAMGGEPVGSQLGCEVSSFAGRVRGMYLRTREMLDRLAV